MSESISIVPFSEIPASWRVPGTYVEIRPNYTNTGITEWPARALIMGQATSAGSATNNRLYQVTRPDQAVGLFGAGSVLARMCAAFLRANPSTPLYAIAVPNPSGAAATGTYVFSGTPSVAGQVAAYIGGDRISIPVAVADTATALAIKLRDAINARTDLPVTATAATGTVTVAFKHAGTLGNDLPLKRQIRLDDVTPAGLTFTQTDMTGGTGDINLLAAVSLIASDWFTDLIIPYTDTTTLAGIEAELARRYAANATLDAHLYIARGGTFSALSGFGAARNSPFVTCLGMSGIVSAPWEIAATLAAVCSFQLTNDPARQLRGLALPGIVAPPGDALFIESERDLLLRDGISTFKVLQDGTVVLERVITMYQQTNLGVADTAWLDIMTPKTLSRIRHDWRTYTQLAYPRHKLAPDDAIAAQYSDIVVTPRIMQSSWAGRCTLYERRGWIEGAEETVRQSVFTIDGTDKNRLNSRQLVRIIGNLMVLAVALEFEV